MKKKLLLVNPKIETQYRNFNFLPPISLGILAALTPSHWEIDIVDENLEGIPKYEYDLVGITTNTLNIQRAYNISGIFRQKSIPVIMGGCHASAVPLESVNFSDSVVIGDAESKWPVAIRDFENGDLHKTYSGIDSSFDYISPDVSHFKNKYVFDAVETSRGCNNNCSYCGVHVPYRRPYKRKPLEMLISELQNSKNPYVFFIDNNFYGNDDEYLYLLFEEMIRKKLKKTWQTGVSESFFKNNELVKLAAKAGAKMFFVGFESDTTVSLNELNKNNFPSTRDIFSEYKKIINLCHSNSIMVSGNYMIGIENDTEESIKNRTEFFSNLNLDVCASVILTPLPNTVVFKKYQQEGRLIYTDFPVDWKNYYYGRSLIKHDNLKNERIEELTKQNNKLFRITFSKIVKSLWTTRSVKGFILYYYYCFFFANYKNRKLEKIINFLK